MTIIAVYQLVMTVKWLCFCFIVFSSQMSIVNIRSRSMFYQLYLSFYYSQLRDAFIYQLTQGYSHYDRQLRNDLLVIASMIATCCLQAPFIETGFAKQLVLLGTFQEGKFYVL